MLWACLYEASRESGKDEQDDDDESDGVEADRDGEGAQSDHGS